MNDALSSSSWGRMPPISTSSEPSGHAFGVSDREIDAIGPFQDEHMSECCQEMSADDETYPNASHSPPQTELWTSVDHLQVFRHVLAFPTQGDIDKDPFCQSTDGFWGNLRLDEDDDVAEHDTTHSQQQPDTSSSDGLLAALQLPDRPLDHEATRLMQQRIEHLHERLRSDRALLEDSDSEWDDSLDPMIFGSPIFSSASAFYGHFLPIPTRIEIRTRDNRMFGAGSVEKGTPQFDEVRFQFDMSIEKPSFRLHIPGAFQTTYDVVYEEDENVSDEEVSQVTGWEHRDISWTVDGRCLVMRWEPDDLLYQTWANTPHLLTDEDRQAIEDWENSPQGFSFWVRAPSALNELRMLGCPDPVIGAAARADASILAISAEVWHRHDPDLWESPRFPLLSNIYSGELARIESNGVDGARYRFEQIIAALSECAEIRIWILCNEHIERHQLSKLNHFKAALLNARAAQQARVSHQYLS